MSQLAIRRRTRRFRAWKLPRLPLIYLPLGALALWVLGQLAVLAPARRAAALPPAHAMRGLA